MRLSQSPFAWKNTSVKLAAASSTVTRDGAPFFSAGWWRATVTSTVATAGGTTSRMVATGLRSTPPVGSVRIRSRGVVA